MARIAICAAALVLLIACFSPAFQADDAWGHLAAGRYMAQTHKLPAPDPFAFTAYIGAPTDSRQLTREWLSQVLMYLAYRAGDLPFVVFLRTLLLCGACGLAGLVVWRRSANFPFSIAATLLPAAIAFPLVADRPVIFTLVFVAAIFALVQYRRWSWALPLLFVVWANCDGGFSLGWVVLIGLTLVRRKLDWRLCLAAAASIAASGINPNGLHLASWSLALLWAGAAIALPVVAASVCPWRPKELDGKWALLAIILILAAVAIPIRQKRAFQFAGNESTRPLGAVKFLLAHHVAGPVFNPASEGGYLSWHLWPNVRVFADSRQLNSAVVPDYRGILYADTAPGRKDAFQLLDQYGVQALVLTAFDYRAGTPHFLIAMLADPSQSAWKLVYQDGQSQVFLREPPAGVRVLPNIAALTSMEAQCAAHIRLVPDEPLCARETCKLYEHLGNLNRARAWMAYYLEHKKAADPAAETEYQRLTQGIPRALPPAK